MARAPLLLAAISFVGSIGLGSCGPVPRMLVAASAVALLGVRSTRAVAAFALGGALWSGLRDAPIVERETRTVRIAGTVIGDVRSNAGLQTFALACDGGPVVSVALREPVAAGERLELRGRLAPFDEARNPGEPSRRALARGEGIGGTLESARLLTRAPPSAWDARAWPARARAMLSRRLRSVLAAPEADVVAGALWGERGSLPRDLHDDFQATGTVHVLVTAGLHLGVIAGVVLQLVRWCGLGRVAGCLTAIPCVIAYAWLSGAHLPSQRAAVMVSVALLARACGARLISWNALGLAAIVIAALWPPAVTTVSFALSFSCVSAIVLFARPLEPLLERLPVPARVREALALTLSTQIGVWPLSAATFGLLSPYAVLANVVVVPATALAMIAGMATLACAGLPVLGALAALATRWDVDAILAVVRHVAALPGARVSVAPPPAAAIVAYDAVVLAAARLLPARGVAAAALIVLGSAGVLATALRFPDGRLSITMLDVGQADASVVRTPRGRIILIDSGGRLEHGTGAQGASPAEEAGERVVLAYLRREGIRRVDLLINTHPHGDHVGGCAPIVNALTVTTIFDSGQPYAGRAFRDCMAAARAHAVPVVLARRGMRWNSGDGVSLDVLAPAMPFLADTGDDVNENSIVVMLRYLGFRELFMGDAGETSEARLLASGDDLHADVVKVGHHGSRYASTPTFVAAVHPRIALISVGRHNTFGHPAPATIEAWSRAGADVLRTDRCGAIALLDQSRTTMLPCTTP